jgi:hypothetical protein
MRDAAHVITEFPSSLQSANNGHLNPAFASPSRQCDFPSSQYKRFKEQLNRTHRFGRIGAGYLAGGHRTDNGR